MNRWSVTVPILLGVAMIFSIVVLTVGWVLLSVFGAQADDRSSALYWTLLPIGSILLLLILAGVIAYLTLSIKAIQLNRRQANFIDSVTHELKSPIASLKLFLQTLDSRRVAEQERASFQRMMLDDLERLEQLIDQLLAAALLDKHRRDEELENVDIGALLEEVVRDIRQEHGLDARQIRLRTEPAEIRARRGDVELICRNIIDNAVKYSAPHPMVEVRVSGEPSEEVRIQVSDNGRGIPRRHRRKVFARFERLAVEIERETPGTGLGLSIVHTLVKQLRGRIAIRDRRPPPGTEFEVRLPRAPRPLPEDPEQIAPRASELGDGGLA